MILVWRFKLIWVVQCFRFRKQRLVHCVDVSFAGNDVGMARQAYLGCSRLWIQEPWIGALWCGGLLILGSLSKLTRRPRGGGDIQISILLKSE